MSKVSWHYISGRVPTLQSPHGRLAGCSSWHLRFVVFFKWRQFEPEVILLAVGWYLRFFTVVP
jgi:hypothetical protein